MAESFSLLDLIKDLYYDRIYNELSNYVEDNPDDLGCSTYNVESPDEASLDSLKLHKIRVKQGSDNWLYFDVIGIAELEISATVKGDREVDSVQQWFKISCSAQFDIVFSNFTIDEIYVYNKYRSKENNLSEYLIPIIYKDQLDDVAESFLKKYYPRALIEPTPISVWEVANRMGLNIKEVHITKNCTFFGQIFFSDCETQYYDIKNKKYKQLFVKRGTILVDPKVYFLRNLGCVNNTITHECVHWKLHKGFFDLQRTYNQDIVGTACSVEENTKAEENWTHYDWAEWQANSLAPRILMPKNQTKQKVDELINYYKEQNPNSSIIKIMKNVVIEMSSFYGVSKLAAKIRLIDLGYKEVIGINTFIDRSYIDDYSFDPSVLKDNQTFDIGIKDALFEYATNINFRELLDSGKYVYVDNHFCINHPEYVYYNENGLIKLTEYALSHLDECCLIFDIEANKTQGIRFYQEKVLYRNAVTDRKIDLRFIHNFQNQKTDKTADEYKKIGLDAMQDAEIAMNLPTSFSGSLKAHMDRLDVKVEKLAERSLVSVKTIQRMRNEVNYSPKLGSIIAVCVGLQLRPALSLDLVSKGGYVFKQFDPEHIIYQFILNFYYLSTIYECNEILRSNSYKVLGKEE